MLMAIALISCLIISASASMDAGQSTITGTSGYSNTALDPLTVTVTAKNSGGSNVGSGGELIYIQITNECSKTSNFACTEVSGADNSMPTSVFTEMTDNEDGTYSYVWTPTNEGTMSIAAIRFNRFTVLGTYYNTIDLTGAVVNTNYSTTVSYNWGAYNVTSNKDDQVSAKYEAYLKAPITGTVTLIIYTDNYAALWVDGAQKFNYMSAGCVCERTATVSMTKDQYYHIEAHWAESGGGAIVDFRWNYTGQAKQTIPSDYWYYPEYIGNSPINYTISCPSGYTGTNSSNPNVCSEICGDNKKVGDEVCDNGTTDGASGCASDCRSITASWVCIGGTPTSADTCSECTSGWYQNDPANPTVCVTRCGDGLEAGTEKCDDGNTVDGDGCAHDCSTVETSWVCTGGSTTTADTCTFCTSGWYQNDATDPDTCVTQCGDGLEAGTEKCDDGDTGGGDGCAADCSTVEAGWVCSGGSTTTADTCTQCADGYHQNDATNPEVCVTVCGDGFEAGDEKCDDGDISGGDGCAADCSTVEAGWVCSGGSPTSADTCTLCAPGYHQDSPTNPENCVTVCGDGLEAGTEKCDDGNTDAGDGCAADCSTVESSWVCIGGSPTSADICHYCSPGWEQNDATNPETCEEVCGDGRRVGVEACDDGNTSSGDGCSSDCRDIEDLYICEFGDWNVTDICKTCLSNYEPNAEQDKCIPAEIVSAAHTLGSIFLGFVFVGVFFNFLTVVTSNYFYQSFFSMINQVQLIMLIPLLGVYIPEKIIDFNRVVDACFGSFAPISKHLMPTIFQGVDNYDFDQGNWYLHLIELESGSTFYSITGIGLVIFMMSIFHGCIYLCNDLTLEPKEGSKSSKILTTMCNWLTWGAYVRLFMFCYVFLLTISMFEIKTTDNRFDHPTSYYVACTVLTICVVSTVYITFAMLKSSLEESILTNAKPSKFKRELTNAIKQNKLARMYYPLFLIQRLIMVASVSLYESSGGKIKTGAFIAIQFFFLCYVIIARPFTRIKDNLGEIVNQLFLLALFGMVGYKMSADTWSDGETNIFIGLILTNAILFSVIAIGGFIGGLITEIDSHEGPNANAVRNDSQPPPLKREVTQNNDVTGMTNNAMRPGDIHRKKMRRTNTEFSHTGDTQFGVQPMQKQDFKKGLNIMQMY